MDDFETWPFEHDGVRPVNGDECDDRSPIDGGERGAGADQWERWLDDLKDLLKAPI